MTTARRSDTDSPQHADRLYIDGQWVTPSTDATFHVIDSGTEAPWYRVAEAARGDVSRAIAAARHAFDDGPWPRLTHAERADLLLALGAELDKRTDEVAELWTRETGVLHSIALRAGSDALAAFAAYAELSDSFAFQETVRPTAGGEFGMLVREPVGVVGAIIPWNGPLDTICHKIGPALLAGCTVIVKSSPEAPGEAYLVAEAAAAIGLPPGVLNVVTADRPVSELLVRDPAVDKISFTGSTAAGQRIASLCGQRVARCTLELGGKSAAIILDDADIETTAAHLVEAQCFLTGQVCALLSRIVVTRRRAGELVDALAEALATIRVGDPFHPGTDIGPLATHRQRERVEGYIARGIAEGSRLVAGGGRPRDLERGWYVEPTLFADVDNSAIIARDEIFGPVLSVITATDEEDAIAIANDSIYGLNASVFTPDVDRAFDVARQLRTGTVGHNAFRVDFGLAFGGFKRSGIGREGVREGLYPFLETKTVILDAAPSE